MTMLSDEELAANLDYLTDYVGRDNDGTASGAVNFLRAHIDALAAQRDNARSIAVSLEQELAEVQATPQRWLIGSGSTEGASDTTKVTAWNATPAVYPVGDES